MTINKPLTLLMSLSLAALSAQLRAEQAPAATGAAQDAPRPAADSEDWTWFGMGFESRQDHFRREMEVDLPSSGSASGSAGGSNGQGGGK
jgi:hypothetical protein